MQNHDTIRAAQATIRHEEVMAMHEEFKHYRSSGVSLAVFLITLNGVVLAWMNNKLPAQQLMNDTLTAIIIAVIFVASFVSILTSVTAQFTQFQGYKNRARSAFEGIEGNADLHNKYKGIADRWFSSLDKLIVLSLVSFIISVLFAVVFAASTLTW